MDLRGIWSKLQKISLCAASTLAMQSAHGVTESDVGDIGLPPPGKILIEYPAQVFLPYRERRPRHQFTAHLQYENFAPTGYLSPVIPDPTIVSNTYKDTYDLDDIPIISAAVGWKFNVPFMGIELAAFYGQGSLQSSKSGEPLSLDLEKYGLKFAAYLETLFSEPYVVPYISAQMQLWGIEEKSSGLKFSRTTGYAVGFGAGMLFQLNWIEPGAAFLALKDGGLNNTYLDVFIQQYGDTSDSKDPVMSSEFNWGAGLRLEY